MDGFMRSQDELVDIADGIEHQFREMQLEVQEVLMILGLLNGFVYDTYTKLSLMHSDDEDHPENWICEDCERKMMGEHKPEGENNNG